MTTRGASDMVARRRLLTYGLLGLALVVSCIFLRNNPWQGSEQLHTLMETLAAFLAFIVGSMALVRFYSKKHNSFLIIGTAFLGTAFLDTYHAVVTSVWIKDYLPSNLASLIPWSWSASRLFLSAVLFLSYIAWRREQRLGDAGRFNERTIYVVATLLTLSSFLFFTVMPLPRAYYPEYVFHRPEEFVPALLFLFALICYFRKGRWQQNFFEHWLILSLITGLATQALVMPFSAQLFDIQFDAAHLLKMASYLCVLIGLFLNMGITFRQAEQRAVALANRKALLTQQVAERTEELSRSESLLKQAVHIAGLGHWRADQVASEFLDVSEEYARIFGYTIEEFMRRYRSIEQLMNLIHPEDRDRIIKEFQENQSGRVKYRIVRQDGAVRTVQDIFTHVLDETGCSTRSFGTLQDITELREVECELRAAKEAAEAANRAKSAFLANMNHELRTPLHIIIGYSDLMQDEVKQLHPEKSSLSADLQVINKAGKQLVAMITDVLALSKIGAGEMKVQVEHFAVKDLVEAVAEAVKPMARQRGNSLEVTCPAQTGAMKSDMSKTHHVLHNLMSNAAKFTDKGRIEVDVQRESCNGSDFIRFQVRDTGIGMSTEQAAEVFEPFVQAENSTTSGEPGTGLGLAISREFCRMLGGEITVESEPGQGSVFTVRLPAAITGPQG